MRKSRDMSGWAIIFLLIMYFSSVGLYTTTKNEYFIKNAYGYALFDVAISSIIMMAEPFIRRLINKEKLPLEKGKNICFANSVCLFILSCVIYILFGVTFIGGLGAIMYYFINKWLFVNLDENVKTNPSNTVEDNSLKKRGEHEKIGEHRVDKNEEKIIDLKNNKKDLAPLKKETLVCSNCGNVIKESDEKCKQCGETFAEHKKETNRLFKNSKNDMDQKYSDLKKLKELYDEKIITKEEFEREKSKIING